MSPLATRHSLETAAERRSFTGLTVHCKIRGRPVQDDSERLVSMPEPMSPLTPRPSPLAPRHSLETAAERKILVLKNPLPVGGYEAVAGSTPRLFTEHA